MTNQLTFKNTTLSPIVLNGQTYFTSSDLAIMLDYKNSKSVNKIYNANSDEFTDEMTIITDSVINGNIGTTDSVVSKRTANLKYSTRIFNLRGCHLVAMFARTPVAKECRKWILDLIEKEMADQKIKMATTPPVDEYALKIICELYNFGLQAFEMREKLRAYPHLIHSIDSSIGGYYLYNLDRPLEQTLENTKKYVQSESQRLMCVRGIASLVG